MQKTTVQYYKKNRKCCNYVVDKKVIARDEKHSKICPRQHCALVGKTVRVCKGRNGYKVELKLPGTNKLTSQWFSVRGYYWFSKKVTIKNDDTINETRPLKCP